MYLYGKDKTKYEASLGKVITSAAMVDDGHEDGLHLDFADGTSFTIYDSGQSCCEHRYITCDDNPADLVGKPFAGVEEKAHDTTDGEWGDAHEQMFVEIKAGDASITMTTHNEHNGYYGGFSVSIK